MHVRVIFLRVVQVVLCLCMIYEQVLDQLSICVVDLFASLVMDKAVSSSCTAGFDRMMNDDKILSLNPSPSGLIGHLLFHGS